ncbi:MAG: glycoside hydrolase family 32 protein [Chthoniobacter sp.]|uniref:glycoside hydrolase family 32 protein n=1 Tax=Chthoniobacter sp. TaxID=2510640 RepID=UPI0032ACB347
MKTSFALFSIFLALASPQLQAAQPDILIADFEGDTYGDWKAIGSAFGDGPAHGALPHQMPVDGFVGKGLVDSFSGGDRSTGTLTSPEFRIERKFIAFLIGGGGWEGKTCLHLVINGKPVRTATGPNTQPGGSERLAAGGWDVTEFAGQTARLVIVDDATGGWGHINVDQIVQTDTAPPVATKLIANVGREIEIAKHWLNFPVKTGGNKRVITISVDGQPARKFDIELADAEPDWWAPLDVSAWAGRKVTVSADKLPEKSAALEALRQTDDLIGAENLYHEPLRPQLQFSPRRGWMNDPNGLAFYRGEYHLFYQHNPYGWNWGNMHWGHATSPDLVHWQERGEVLYPDDMGPMFSGSAVVDWKNTSGLGHDGQPPLVLIYTAAGNPTVQCLASSTDGRTFTKFAGNPVIKEITRGNRDPKVFWHEPSKQWVLTLYVGVPNPTGELDAKGKAVPLHTIHFFTSPNLKDWTLRSQTPGLYECPDFFELPVDGDASKKKWVLTAASSEYFVGSFDGQKFTPETPKLPGHRGRGFYAAQTFSDVPDGRRIQIGWGQAPSPGMPFNQLQTFPCELQLHQTPEGPRLRRSPIKELETLRGRSWKFQKLFLNAGAANPLADVRGELLEVHADFQPAADSEVTFKVRGVDIHYSAAQQEISVNGIKAPAPLQDGHQRLTIFTDRTYFTIFASDGLTYIPFPVIARPAELGVEVQVKGGATTMQELAAYALKSIWEASH